MNADERDELTRPYERSVATRGLSPESIWMDREDSLTKGLRRCEAMFAMIGDNPAFSLLDVGCGPGYALGFAEQRYGASMLSYLGVDISPEMVKAANRLWPARRFECRDVAADPLPPQSFDFAILNGVLTARFGLTHAAMEALAEELLVAVWNSVHVGLSFNVMSTLVDWTRDDLFHWPFDRAATFCARHLSRHFNIIADYGLYEYTVQVYRQPRRCDGSIPEAWKPGKSV